MQPRSRKISRPAFSVSAFSVTISGRGTAGSRPRYSPCDAAATASARCSRAPSDARHRHAVAAVAGSAAELLGIVDLEQLLIGVAGEHRIAAHRRRRQDDRLARAQVAGLAAVHQVHVLDVDLPDANVELLERILHRQRSYRCWHRRCGPTDTCRAGRAARWPASSLPRASAAARPSGPSTPEAAGPSRRTSSSAFPIRPAARPCGSPPSTPRSACAASPCGSRCGDTSIS